jgi:hypothetical protein
MFFDLSYFRYFLNVKFQLFVTLKLTRIRILIGLATWIRIRIEIESRIRVETNAESFDFESRKLVFGNLNKNYFFLASLGSPTKRA